MRKPFFHSILTCFLGLISTVYAKDIQNQDLLDHITEYAQGSIEKVEQEKVFIRPEYLTLSEGEILLVGEYGHAIRLPHLFSDQAGLYVTKGSRETIYICRNCTKAYYNYKPDKCEVCLGSDFLVRFR